MSYETQAMRASYALPVSLVAVATAFGVLFIFAATSPFFLCTPPACNGHTACPATACFPWALAFFVLEIAFVVAAILGALLVRS